MSLVGDGFCWSCSWFLAHRGQVTGWCLGEEVRKCSTFDLWSDLGFVLLYPQLGTSRTMGHALGSSCSQSLAGAPACGLGRLGVSAPCAQGPSPDCSFPCLQAFCDDASGLKFNPVLYPKVR